MARPAALCLLLLLPLSWSQDIHHAPPAPPGPGGPVQPAAPPAAPRLGDLLREGESSRLSPKQAYARMQKDNQKVGLFIAAAVGTISLMAAVYCIYNRFYTKHQYLHTQLDDNELSLDTMENPPMFFHGSVGSVGDARRPGYGSLCDTPSTISVPPCLSPPPSVISVPSCLSPPPSVISVPSCLSPPLTVISVPPAFPALFRSSRSLRTISAQDLEKSFL